jgi:hypothetical protein
LLSIVLRLFILPLPEILGVPSTFSHRSDESAFLKLILVIFCRRKKSIKQNFQRKQADSNSFEILENGEFIVELKESLATNPDDSRTRRYFVAVGIC